MGHNSIGTTELQRDWWEREETKSSERKREVILLTGKWTLFVTWRHEQAENRMCSIASSLPLWKARNFHVLQIAYLVTSRQVNFLSYVPRNFVCYFKCNSINCTCKLCQTHHFNTKSKLRFTRKYMPLFLCNWWNDIWNSYYKFHFTMQKSSFIWVFIRIILQSGLITVVLCW